MSYFLRLSIAQLSDLCCPCQITMVDGTLIVSSQPVWVRAWDGPAASTWLPRLSHSPGRDGFYHPTHVGHTRDQSKQDSGRYRAFGFAPGEVQHSGATQDNH